MPAYHYRITVDMLQETGEDGLHSLSFFASNQEDVFAAASQLRNQFGLTACHAACLAVGVSLVRQAHESHAAKPLAWLQGGFARDSAEKRLSHIPAAQNPQRQICAEP